jgi:hypothetical protein
MRSWRATWLSALALLFAGCYSGPLQENPIVVRPAKVACTDNPLFVPIGPRSYGLVFEKCITVLHGLSFEIARSNRFDGYIETHPTVAPGLGQPWKGGSPDVYQRLLASFQSIRQRAIIRIKPVVDGGILSGYFISVEVYKELEDVPTPVRQTAGAAIFQSNPTVERQAEVIEAGVFNPTWIPLGRDTKFEQVILERLANYDLGAALKKAPPAAE